MEEFLKKLKSVPEGYSEGCYRGRRYGATLKVSADGQRMTFYAEDLGGKNIISFNLYILKSGASLRPCEMTAEKVIEFVLGYEPRA